MVVKSHWDQGIGGNQGQIPRNGSQNQMELERFGEVFFFEFSINKFCFILIFFIYFSFVAYVHLHLFITSM